MQQWLHQAFFYLSSFSVVHFITQFFFCRSDYLIVAGHHPILSAGAHGNSPCLMTKLKPLLEKYDVTAYFSGHDHNLQVSWVSSFLKGFTSDFSE